ncbi:lipocalin-like domain-containing protein [Syntrophus aciditrophicus]|uniref:Hypothetical exported protein n=1 Tax=Syntrophus aciditrophicus (strain SB) TaxID=56780 RepID=Q2LVD5_SYNAS|nr:lipocalin-like domain-containing protein [Syntrophus aciditrophicus]ABC78047.1 hypothetical exported protein [Syntrophus aciditrophicus SB]OPY18958.1 MAG: Hydroxyneurosporene synthase (CrtC) [Syntrophus sp. PtaB.Bin075]
MINRYHYRNTSFLILIIMILACAPAGAEGEWKQATGPRQWSFPRDHGNHPEFRTEWWYFTGNLIDAEGNRYGYQLTFFRHGIRQTAPMPSNPWSIRDVYPAHFAVTDVAGAKFSSAERISRSGPGLAGSKQGRMNVWNLNWFARMENGRIHIGARSGQTGLDLNLRPKKPPVLHDRNGLSRKGSRPGQASYYYSFTDLETTGNLETTGTGRRIQVNGTSWFDHEFGSNTLAEDQTGWDWFSLHFSDGRDLMIYFLRKKDGSLEKESSGTLVESNGISRHLDLSEIRIRTLRYWTSAKTGGRYPAGWQIDISSADLSVRLDPLLQDQELTTPGSTGVNYYEGAVTGKGLSQQKPVTCEGYIEMTGYAGSIGGLF